MTNHRDEVAEGEDGSELLDAECHIARLCDSKDLKFAWIDGEVGPQLAAVGCNEWKPQRNKNTTNMGSRPPSISTLLEILNDSIAGERL